VQSSQLLSTHGGVNVLIYAPDLCPRMFLRVYIFILTFSEYLEFLAWYSLVHFTATAIIIFI
jgi:hypothetical protein